MGRYYTAQVCSNGHHTTDSLEISRERSSKFCSQCGASTASNCQHCQVNIRGHYYVDGVISISAGYVPPKFCYNCGKPFPWTSAKIAAAQELADEAEALTTDERAQLKDTIVDLIQDSPRTELATVRYKKLLKKAGTTIGAGLNSIVVSIATEAAKKFLGF